MNDILVKRWEKPGTPGSHKVIDALEIALHRVKTGEIDAQHVVICFGSVGEDQVANTDFLQAGSFSFYAQCGLVHAILRLMTKGES